MLAPLKFVKGAVAKKDYQPALTHFRIKNGRVMGYNGVIALSSPINLDLEATPQAIPFVKAIERCNADTTAIGLTPGGRLSLKSGKFKAFVECHDDSELLDAVEPEGQPVEFDEFLNALRVLHPYIGTDASRPWATGILLRGQSAYATNNIILAEYWIGTSMPEINLPAAAIDELIRIGEEPISARMGENSITFFFENDRWMRTQLLGTSWPDINDLLNNIKANEDMLPFPEGFYEAIETLKPFVELEGRVFFRDGKMATSPHEGEGASVAIEGLHNKGAYHHKHLQSLQDRAVKIDFTTHPKPCPFEGKNLRGVILGMVDAE